MVSVTATPYCDEGLKHLADVMLRPITMQTLIDQGHLVPFSDFRAFAEPDLVGVKVSSSTKDYVTGEIRRANGSGSIDWKK